MELCHAICFYICCTCKEFDCWIAVKIMYSYTILGYQYRTVACLLKGTERRILCHGCSPQPLLCLPVKCANKCGAESYKVTGKQLWLNSRNNISSDKNKIRTTVSAETILAPNKTKNNSTYNNELPVIVYYRIHVTKQCTT